LFNTTLVLHLRKVHRYLAFPGRPFFQKRRETVVGCFVMLNTLPLTLWLANLTMMESGKFKRLCQSRNKLREVALVLGPPGGVSTQTVLLLFFLSGSRTSVQASRSHGFI
jgi:hypothetical protein